MTKRNIAIANFSPKEVFNSSWPRFVGWKLLGKPVISSGLFGLVDASTRMHAFFRDTSLEDVIATRLSYSLITPDVVGSPSLVSKVAADKSVIYMQAPRAVDTSISWLPPYQFIDETGTEWDVYVLITGADIHIKGTFHKTIKSDGYWDMGIWKPKIEEGAEWTDIQRIEQTTINYVHEHGYQAKTSITMFSDNPDYGKYHDCDVTCVVPDRIK